MKVLGILVGLFMAFEAFGVVTAPMSNQYSATGSISRRDAIKIRVKNGAGSAVAYGNVLCLDTTSDDGAEVKFCSSDGEESAVCVATQAIADGAMGYCQIFGYFDAIDLHAETAYPDRHATAGRGVYVSSAGSGYVSGFSTDSGTGSALDASYKRIGTFLDSATATGTVEVFLSF